MPGEERHFLEREKTIPQEGIKTEKQSFIENNMGIGLNEATRQKSFQEKFKNPNAPLEEETDPARNLSVSDFTNASGIVRPTNPNILRGTYSGRMIGSVPIFGANMSPEIGNTTSREHALQKAAYDEAKAKQTAAEERRKKLLEYDPYGELDKVNDERYNENLRQQSISEIDAVRDYAKMIYGPDKFLEVLGTPSSEEAKRIGNIIQNHDIIAGKINDIFTDVAEMQQGGDKIYSPATRQAASELMSRINRFADSKPEELVKYWGKFKGSKTVDKWAHDNMPESIKQTVNKWVQENERQGKIGLDNLTVKSIPSEFRDPLFKSIKENMRLSDSFGFTPDEEDEMINTTLDNLFRTEIETRFQNLSASGYGEEEENVQSIVKDQRSAFTHNNKTYAYTASDAMTFDPFDVIGSSDQSIVDAKTGESIDTDVPFKVDVGDLQNIPVFTVDYSEDSDLTEGTPVPESLMKLATEKGIVEYRPFLVGTAEIKNLDYDPNDLLKKKNKEFLHKEVRMPADRHRQPLKKRNIPIDEFQERADKKNHELKLRNVPKKEEEGQLPEITQDEFDAQWAKLKPGESLLAPDGKTYTKQPPK